MINITRIEFENYRQYKSVALDFHANSQYNLFVLKAKNGTGKTTLLNGILWCLYEKEYYLNNSGEPLPILNSSVIQGAGNKDNFTARVKVSIDNDGESIVFERNQVFSIGIDPFNNTKKAIPHKSSLKVIITTPGENTKVIEDDEQVTSIVKQYFDQAIFDYYFFDGENLKNYFIKDEAKRIKSSIYNIAQVTLLSNANAHVKSLSEELARTASKIDDSDIEKLYQQESDLNERIKRLNEEIEEQEGLYPKAAARFKKADDLLRAYEPIKIKTKERFRLEAESKKLKTQFEEFKEKKQKFIVDYLTLLNFYPRIKTALEIISEKEKAGDLPPSVDKTQIKNIIDNHLTECPVCKGVIDDERLKILSSLLDELEFSQHTSHYLTQAKPLFEHAVSECNKFEKLYENINAQEKAFKEEIERNKKELEEINAFLSTYENSDDTIDGGFDVKQLEKNRSDAMGEMKSINSRIDLDKGDINRSNKELEDVKKQIENFESKQNKKSLLYKQVRLLRTINSNYERVRKDIAEEIKKDITIQTWRRFDSMIWKRNTFGQVNISDSYELTVIDKDGREMTGSLSATELMALAYSFTLAIHKASGKNCPLVVDSPLGRVSDENRENMAKELLEVSKEKQIIMLFTPDEYSEEVRRVYQNKVSVRNIELSSDEGQIESIGDNN